jgi:hypothetical protein
MAMNSFRSLGALILCCGLASAFGETPTLQAPPTSALKHGWYATQLGPPHYDPDPKSTNLWSMYQFCFANARQYHIEKFHVTLAHLSADPTCVRVDGKAPESIPRRPGCVSVQLTADCVAEPAGIIPEVDPQKLTLAWTKAFAASGVQVSAADIAYQDGQPNGLLKYQIRVSNDYRPLPSIGWLGVELANGAIKAGAVEGATYLLLGSVQVEPASATSKGGIRVNSRLVEVETGEVVRSAKGVSPAFSQFGLELDARDALTGLNMPLR